MARTKLSAAQLRDRKAKRLAIGLSVVFAGVLAFQGPTILKLFGGSSSATPPVPPAASTTTTSGQPTPSTPGPTLSGAPPSGALPSPAVPTALGQLTNFSGFGIKDPFFAQVGVVLATASTKPAAPATKPKVATTPKVSKPKPSPQPEAAKPIPVTMPTTTAATTVPFSTAPTVPPNAALIVTNGKREIVPVGKVFPRDRPLFKLVALATHMKAIRISVLGGSFANGAATLLLRRGTSLTLANESDGGFRYAIKLLKLTTATTPTGAATAPAAGSTGANSPTGSG